MSLILFNIDSGLTPVGLLVTNCIDVNILIHWYMVQLGKTSANLNRSTVSLIKNLKVSPKCQPYSSSPNVLDESHMESCERLTHPLPPTFFHNDFLTILSYVHSLRYIKHCTAMCDQWFIFQYLCVHAYQNILSTYNHCILGCYNMDINLLCHLT